MQIENFAFFLSLAIRIMTSNGIAIPLLNVSMLFCIFEFLHLFSCFFSTIVLFSLVSAVQTVGKIEFKISTCFYDLH